MEMNYLNAEMVLWHRREAVKIKVEGPRKRSFSRHSYCIGTGHGFLRSDVVGAS